jgi:UDPglucose 6-dehydrogenase
MQAIVNSNTLRKYYIAKSIIEKKPKSVGVYRLVMKKGSDNFRESAIQGIISRLIESNINIVIYEPNFKEKYFQSIKILNNLDLFKSSVDLIIANRIEFLEDLEDVMEKVYTRDIYGDG